MRLALLLSLLAAPAFADDVPDLTNATRLGHSMTLGWVGAALAFLALCAALSTRRAAKTR